MSKTTITRQELWDLLKGHNPERWEVTCLQCGCKWLPAQAADLGACPKCTAEKDEKP